MDPDPEMDPDPDMDFDADLDVGPVGVGMLDRADQTNWVNEVVGRPLGYSAEELAAEPLWR